MKQKQVNSQQKYLLKQHMKTKMQQSLPVGYAIGQTGNSEEISTTNEEFYHDFCLALVFINAAWNTLNNPVWRGTLEKYT